MSEEKKDFFDYDNYVKNNQSKKKKKKASAKKKQAEEAADKPKKKQDKESIDNIKRMFDEALDENREELSELTEAPVEPEMPVSNPEGFRRKLYMLFGMVVTVLAIVGLVATVNFAVDKVKAFADNTQQKNEFAKFVYPIVICDPAPFNQTIKLRSDTMITAALWDIILYVIPISIIK